MVSFYLKVQNTSKSFFFLIWPNIFSILGREAKMILLSFLLTKGRRLNFEQDILWFLATQCTSPNKHVAYIINIVILYILNYLPVQVQVHTYVCVRGETAVCQVN